MPWQDLEAEYAGIALFVRPQRHSLQEPGTPGMPGTGAANSGLNWFWPEVRRHGWVFARLLAASVTLNLLALAAPLFVMNIYDRVLPNHAVETLWAMAVGVAIAFLFDFILKNLRYHFVDATGRNLDTQLSSRIYEKLLSLRMDARQASVGGVANQVRSFEGLRDFFASATVTALVDLPFAALFIVVIAHLGGNMAWIPAITGMVILIIGITLQSSLLNFMRLHFREGAQKNGHLVETIQMIETIKCLGLEGRMQQKWESMVDAQAHSAMKERRLASFFLFLTGFFSQVSYAAMIVFGAFLVHDGLLSLGGLIACSILSGRVMAPLMQTASLLTRLHQARVSLAALNRLMSLPSERPPERRFAHKESFRGEIECRNLMFRYPGQKEPALLNVSLLIKPGERVGILGKIGSGKSTLFKLLLGLHVAQQGAMLVDGMDTGQLDPSELRAAIGYASQDTHLFSGTIRENIVIGANHASDEMIWKALTFVGLDNIVNAHHMGLERRVGPQGTFLSGGERQLVVLARALLEVRPMLLLDEPTSALDMATEQALIHRLQEPLRGRTMLLVTQRLTMLHLVDRLLVMDNGRLLGDGPRDEVVRALQEGRFNQPTVANPAPKPPPDKEAQRPSEMLTRSFIS